ALGWVGGALVGRLARAVDLDRRSRTWGLTGALARAGVSKAPSLLLRLSVIWSVFVVFATMGIDALAIPGAPGATRTLMHLLPRTLSALLILVVGWLAANFLGQGVLIPAGHVRRFSYGRGSGVSRCGLAVLGLVLALWPRAAAGETADAPVELIDVTVQSRSDGVRVDVKTSGPPRYRSELMDGPYRLVLDFEDTLYHWTVGPLAIDIDPVKTIRGGQFRANVARLVIELTREVPYRVEAHPRGVRVLLGAGRASAPPGEARVPPAEGPKPAPPWRLAGTVLRAEGSTAYIAD